MKERTGDMGYWSEVTISAVKVEVAITRRGRKRPGQWTDRTRAKRGRRLARAADRRAGWSRRGMCYGFEAYTPSLWLLKMGEELAAGVAAGIESASAP